jgi:hypothetical protein
LLGFVEHAALTNFQFITNINSLITDKHCKPVQHKMLTWYDTGATSGIMLLVVSIADGSVKVADWPC